MNAYIDPAKDHALRDLDFWTARLQRIPEHQRARALSKLAYQCGKTALAAGIPERVVREVLAAALEKYPCRNAAGVVNRSLRKAKAQTLP